MSYDPVVPLQTDSPSIFPAQAQANFTRLKELIEVDHQFNDTLAPNDGYHTLVHLIPQAPSLALPGFGRFYVKTSGGQIEAFYMDNAGTEYQITPTMPIRASVNFNGTGGNGAQVLRSTYKVSDVSRTGTGRYTLTFTAMPDTNYIVQITGMRDSNGAVYGCVEGNATYANSVTVTTLKVRFFDQEGSSQDVLMGNVTILSVS